jgi:hypothetical protein
VSIEVVDGSFLMSEVGEREPIVALDSLGLAMHVARENGQRVFLTEPTVILDRRQLTPELCHHGLHLVAPILADAANVDGTVSLKLENLRIPLEPSPDGTRKFDVSGHVVLHQVSVGVRNPVLKQITDTVGRLLGKEIPQSVRLADEADIHFFVKGDRVHHDGLAFGLPTVSPDLVIRTSGSVGFDRTLDMNVDVPIPLALLRDGPLFRKLSERPLRFHVGGTLDQPVLGLPDDRGWYQELASRLLDGSSNVSAEGPSSDSPPDQFADALLQTLGDLMERRRNATARRSQSAEEAAGPRNRTLADRYRNWRNQRRRRPDTNSQSVEADETDSPAPAEANPQDF